MIIMPVLVFFPNIYDRIGRGTGTILYSFKPYYNYKMHRTKQYALSSITIMFYLEDIVVQKEIILFNYLHLPPMTPFILSDHYILPAIIIIGKTDS